MLADIAGLNGHRLDDFTLDGEVPLVGDGGAVIGIGRVNADAGEAGGGRRSHVRDGAAGGRTERAEALIEKYLVGGDCALAVGGAPLADEIDIPWRIGSEAVVFTGALFKAGAREGRANYRLVIEAIGETQARKEVGDAFVLVVERAVVTVLAGKFDCAGIFAEVSHAVVHFVDRREELPAYA